MASTGGEAFKVMVSFSVSLEESFHKEMIQLGLAGKQSIRDAIWSHRNLIVEFIGDVTDLREHANVDYEDRVGYINNYFTERIIRLHPLHGWKYYFF